MGISKWIFDNLVGVLISIQMNLSSVHVAFMYIKPNISSSVLHVDRHSPKIDILLPIIIIKKKKDMGSPTFWSMEWNLEH